MYIVNPVTNFDLSWYFYQYPCFLELHRFIIVCGFFSTPRNPPAVEAPPPSKHIQMLNLTSVMSFGADRPFLNDILHVSSMRQPFDVRSTITYLLPACLSYIVVAILVTLPGTRTLRIALWPLIAILAFRAAAYVDFSNGNPQSAYLNANFAVSHMPLRHYHCMLSARYPLAHNVYRGGTHSGVDIPEGASQAPSPSCQCYPIHLHGRT